MARRGAGQNRNVLVSVQQAAGPDGVGPLVLEESVGNDKYRKTGMPKRVQPSRALWTGAKQTGWREHAGETYHVQCGHGSDKQVAAGNHEQRP